MFFDAAEEVLSRREFGQLLVGMYAATSEVPAPEMPQLPPPIEYESIEKKKEFRGYPIRKGWWTGCRDYHHLLTGVHSGKFDSDWLKKLTYSQIQSLHSDDHEYKVKWSYVFKPGEFPSKSESPKKASKKDCPNGKCPIKR